MIHRRIAEAVLAALLAAMSCNVIAATNESSEKSDVFVTGAPLRGDIPESSFVKDTVRERRTVIERMRAKREEREEQAQKQEKNKEVELAYKPTAEPSDFFRGFVHEGIFRVDEVNLLQNTVSELANIYSDCRVLNEFDGRGRAVCGAQNRQIGDGDVVLLSYLPSNQILAGIELFFEDPAQARRHYGEIAARLSDRFDTFREEYAEAVDSPFWRLSLGAAAHGAGKWLRVELNRFPEINDFERFASEHVTAIGFGELTLGVTKGFPKPQKLSKDCMAADYNEESRIRKEYLGKCFGFPFDAHIQLDYNDLTGVLERAVLSPLGGATQALVEETLRDRFGKAQFCKRISSPVTINENKTLDVRNPDRRYSGTFGRSGTVYVGTCDDPIVYEVQKQFVLRNEMITHDFLVKEYELRKKDNAGFAAKSHERESRREKLDAFFQ